MMETPDMSTRKEQLVFSTTYVIKLNERSVYDEKSDTWFIEREAGYKRETDGKSDVMNVDVNMFRSYKTVLKNIAVKIKALQYLNNEEALETLRKDILVDIIVLLYKLERGDTA